ncbi:ribonuclease R [Candidatus Magnetoovum chiemensis]|nr:ribonuclease R [Candidatus Magnetoovum chiemensis]
MLEKKEVLEHIKTLKKPVSFRELATTLCERKNEARQLKKTLRQLVSDGDLVKTRKGLYGVSAEMSLYTGYFEAHKHGYGFVIVEKPGISDIFIPLRKTEGAMDNDRVVVRVENYKRREGRIIRILERAHSKIVGKLSSSGNLYYVKPKLKTIPFEVIIPPENIGKAKDGDVVIAEIKEFPVRGRNPIGKIVKQIVKPDTPISEIKSVIEEFNLPKRFPVPVLVEARKLTMPAEYENRIDLRALNTVTIDGERAKDFDDAVSITKIKDGFKLYVHIADVGYFVTFGGTLDLEARKRGNSFYFPDRVIPMLPKELSENLCSLKKGVDRLAFTVEMDFDDAGRSITSKFYQSVINSNERMTYTIVKEILIDKNDKVRRKYDYLLEDLELMETLCETLRAKRFKRGSLDFDLPEPEVLIDISGNLESIIRAGRNFAHNLIEEFMIAANEAVAEYLEKISAPCLYRIHEEPDEFKMEETVNVIIGTGIIKKRNIKPSDFPLILEKAKGTPYEETINYLILRSLKQARYSPHNAGHFGLASVCYCHFTSPIRRYPDLVVHRILRDVLTNRSDFDNKILPELKGALDDIAFHSSHRERLADEAEREVLDALRTWFMKDKIGKTFSGKVIGVSAKSIRVRLNEYFIDGFIPLSEISDDFYIYDETQLCLIGKHKKRKFFVGDSINVKVTGVNAEERDVLFTV